MPNGWHVGAYGVRPTGCSHYSWQELAFHAVFCPLDESKVMRWRRRAFIISLPMLGAYLIGLLNTGRNGQLTLVFVCLAIGLALNIALILSVIQGIRDE